MELPLPQGWRPTAPTFPAPGGHVRRVEGPRGEVGLAIKYRADLVHHPFLVDGIPDILPFLRTPGRSDVAPLLHWDRRQALFLYEIGDRVLLADLMEFYARRGAAPGERVAMELLAASSVVLDGAAREASSWGMSSHGSLDPWRILVDRDGAVSLLGYGLPHVESLAWMDESGAPPELGVAYWPPERIRDAGPEGVYSDIYAMGVIAAELATGHALLEGRSPSQNLETIVTAGGIRREIEQLGGLTREVRHFLMELVRDDEELRPRSGGEMGIRARQLMESRSGRTLVDVVSSMMNSELAGENAPEFDADLLLGDFVDGADDPDEEPTARLDPLYVSAREAPMSPPDPLWGDDEPDPAEATWEMPLDEAAELPELPPWRSDSGHHDTVGELPIEDDRSEEIPRNPASQYEPTSGVFPAVDGDLDEVPADSDRPPRPPTDEQLRRELTDPQAQWSQGPFDAGWDEDSLLDVPEPSLVDEHDPLSDDDGPTYELDPDAVSHVVKGVGGRAPTLFPEDVARADADTRRRRDEELEALDAALEADHVRAEELIEDLQVDDEIWEEQELRRPPSTLSFEPMGAGPEALPLDFDRPFGVEDELEDDVDVDPVNPPISLTAAREAWPDAPHQILLTAAKVDLHAQRVLHDDNGLVALSKHQTAILAYLAARPGRELTSDELFHGAMRGEEGSARSIPGIIARVRKKIERDPEAPDHLMDGEHGGFRFVAAEASTPGPKPLPEPAGPLLGRDRELEQVIDALQGESLVTVTGPPGAGASQVALRAAITLAERGFEVHRAAVGRSESVASMLARGLGIRRLAREESEVLADIGKRLAQQENLVLFLDAPKEHRGLRDLVQGFVDQHPRGVVLVASREALGIAGERLFRLGALRIEEAIEIFRKRVAHYRPGTQVPDALATSVAEHLDRMPMALEAAAARTAFVAPEVLSRRLEQGLELEWGEEGLDADLTATLERIDDVERAALEQLVVFRDGFELSAAETVVVLPDRQRSLITVLESLTAKSLLQEITSDGSVQVRWMVYETVRAYVRREMNPQELEAAQRRHAETFGRLGLELGAGPWVEGPARDALVREQENLRAALQYSIPESGGAALGLTSILGYEDAGRLREAVDRWLGHHKRNPPSRPDLDLLDPSPVQEAFDWTNRENLTWQAAVRLASARLDLHLGQPQKARSSLRETAELATHEVKLLVEVAWLHAELGSTFEAEAALNKVSSADQWVRGVISLLRGRIHTSKVNVRKGERALIEALHAFGEIDAELGKAHVQRHLAEIFVEKGRGRRAISLVREALATFEKVLDMPSALRCRMRIAELLVGLGERDEALGDLDNVLETARQYSANGLLALARGVLGVVRTMEQDFEEGERLFFLALAGSAPDQKRIQALFALALLLHGDRDTAHEEARGALPNSVAQAVVAVLERSGPPHENETAFLLYEALESWRSGAALKRFEAALVDRPSIAVRMVLKCPQPKFRLAGK